MRLAIHQPEFLPWLGFFYKMASADRYVVFDHVQFKKRYFENRNKIVSLSGDVSYVGVPVHSKGRFEQAIGDVEIDNSQAWQKQLLGRLRHAYCKAPYFDLYFPELQILTTSRIYEKLIDYNLALISFFRVHLGISTPLVFSSTLGVEVFCASDLILEICLRNKAASYLCGPSGREYLELEKFKECGVEVIWIDYHSSSYVQQCREFVPGLSTLDLLFNHGPASLRILLNTNFPEQEQGALSVFSYANETAYVPGSADFLRKSFTKIAEKQFSRIGTGTVPGRGG